MVIKIKKKWLAAIALILLCAVLAAAALLYLQARPPQFLMGGTLKTAAMREQTAMVSKQQEEETAAMYLRFRRPSASAALPNPYFGTAQKASGPFTQPKDAVLAYWGLLGQASNMEGYTGGCGSVGEGLLPYPHAYNLLSPAMQARMSQKQFIASFQGIGYITLLQLHPADEKNGTFMVELETIQGEKTTKCTASSGGRFVYYYGLISTEKNGSGYCISGIDLLAEDFLCAPEHGWIYLAEPAVQIIYGENLGLIERIDRTEQSGSLLYVYAYGHGKEYRFDFTRLANGYDLLLRENILTNGAWKETDIAGTESWNYKLVS